MRSFLFLLYLSSVLRLFKRDSQDPRSNADSREPQDSREQHPRTRGAMLTAVNSSKKTKHLLTLVCDNHHCYKVKRHTPSSPCCYSDDNNF
jgi:hypothetical protein